MQYWLPDKTTGIFEKSDSKYNVVIIVGANGSGKSHLVASMEKFDYDNDHSEKRGFHYLRIPAQRDLNFHRYFPLIGQEKAQNEIIFGNSSSYYKGNKWSNNKGEGESWTIAITDDFDAVLANLVSKINEENQLALTQVAKLNDKKDSDKLSDRISKWQNNNSRTKLKKIWKSVLPEREIDVKDNSIVAYIPGKQEKYNGNNMSDGERSCLYLIGQCLCAPEGETIIVDEPELHLHPSIMNRLWQAIEEARPDCHYIFVTHELEFASRHPAAEIIWVKSYDGTKWDYEVITDQEQFPDELMLDILGSRRKILLVEGENDSYDLQLYSSLFNHMYVIPCGSCEHVIEKVRAFSENKEFHHSEVYGLIDRDYRSDEQIAKYEQEGIFTLNVAEVENLFLVRNLLELYCKEIHIPEDEAKQFLDGIQREVEKEFDKQLNDQIKDAVVRNAKYCASMIDIKPRNLEYQEMAIETAFCNKMRDIIRGQWENIEGILSHASKDGEYDSILKVINDKGLINTVISRAIDKSMANINSNTFKDYINYILRMASVEDSSRRLVQEALRDYFPEKLWEIND